MSQPDIQLPDLHEAVINAATLHELVRDLTSLTKLLEVIPRAAPGRYVALPASHTPEDLAAARDLLLAGEIRSLQIRYFYQNATWCDTLLAQPEGYKLIRIQPPVAS